MRMRILSQWKIIEAAKRPASTVILISFKFTQIQADQLAVEGYLKLKAMWQSKVI